MKRPTIFALICFLVSTTLLADEQCKPLTNKGREAIASYLAKRLKLSDSKGLKIDKEEFVRNTCYRKFRLEGASLPQPITLFLSPDLRFVSAALFDTALDPAEEERQEADRVSALLQPAESPSQGRPGAPVTLVEFSDFQCPYCRRFDEWMGSLPPETRARVVLVYKHLPLPMHPWARDAAELAACGSLQSPDAFWALHDFFFKEQEGLNTGNLSRRTAEFASKVPHLNVQELFACSNSHKADSIIARDEELANTMEISATPTVFANGLRGRGLRSIEDLEALIARAGATGADGITSLAHAKLGGARGHR